MDQKKTGSFLRELRKEKQFTQEQLAEWFGVTSRSVSRWETGSNMPDLSILVELADFYDVDIRDIIDGERKGEDVNKEEKERLQLVADYAENEKNTLLMRLRIISIVGLVSLIAGLTMMVISRDNNLPVYDYLMGTLMGVAIGALLVAVFYSTGVLENMRKRKKNAYESAFGNKHINPAWNIHRGNHSIVMIYIMSIATVELAQTKCNML